MSDHNIPSNAFSDDLSIQLPEFRGLPSITVNMTALKTAERRLIEAKTVTPSTYTDLEHTFNEAYRELKRNLSTVGYQIMKTKSEMDKIKSGILLDKYPEFLKEKGSKFDNASMRDAFIHRDPDYEQARDRLDSLTALEVFLEGRVKVMENVSRYMRNAMQLIIRSGVNTDVYYKK
jgi:hypothetical protein